MIRDFNDRDFEFYPEFEYYCYKNCFLQILEYYGVQNAKYYLDCTTDWTCQTGKNEGIVFGTGDPFSSFIPPFDDHVKIYTTDDRTKEQIWKDNIESINNGTPVVIAVDIFYLKYTPYYQKKHSYHSAVLTGYDEFTDEFYVVDWYPPWYFKGKISRDELENSRGSENDGDGILSGDPIKYLFAEIDRVDYSESMRDLIQAQIQRNMDLYYKGVESDGTVKGYKAINSMIDKIEESFTYTKEKQKGFFENLYSQLFFTPYRKKLFHWYLNNAYVELNNFGFEKPIRILDETINTWKVFLSLIIKCSMVSSEKNLELLVKRCTEIIEKEKQLGYELYELNRNFK